jgi:MORN repeat
MHVNNNNNNNNKYSVYNITHQKINYPLVPVAVRANPVNFPEIHAPFNFRTPPKTLESHQVSVLRNNEIHVVQNGESFTGYGIKRSNLGTYTGELKNSLPHGMGEMKYVDGKASYYGKWIEGNYHGLGTLDIPTHGQLKGFWANGTQQCYGKIILNNGITIDMHWKELHETKIIKVVLPDMTEITDEQEKKLFMPLVLLFR